MKLSKERVATLIEQGVGKPFDPGHGRLMKRWLTITSPTASWVELTKEHTSSWKADPTDAEPATFPCGASI